MRENLRDRLYLFCFQMSGLRSIGSQRPVPHFEPAPSISLPWHHGPSPRPTGHDWKINLPVTLANRLRASMVRHERQPSRH
jgi:hypothetical protein